MEGRPTAALRRERVVFETDRHLIVGDVSLPAEGYQARFSDVINRGEIGFIPIVDVEVAPLGGGQSTRREFMVLGKAQIRLAYPLEDDAINAQ